MEYKRGEHPNSLKNLEKGQFKKGQSANPYGRPPGKSLDMLRPLIRVIGDQQLRSDRQASKLSEHLKKLHQAEDELIDALAQIEELQDEAEGSISHFDCISFSAQETYEQQQNYERIKEQLYKENDELKAKVKELQFNLRCYDAKEKDNWSWKEDALRLDKDLRVMEKDRNFWKNSCEASNQLNKSLGEKVKTLLETTEMLRNELKPYREAKLQEAKNKIEMRCAGRARR